MARRKKDDPKDWDRSLFPKKIIKDVTKIGHHGNGNSQINISSSENIGYIEDLLKCFICNML